MINKVKFNTNCNKIIVTKYITRSVSGGVRDELKNEIYKEKL